MKHRATRVVAAIDDAALGKKILAHLGLTTERPPEPPAPAYQVPPLPRGWKQDWGQRSGEVGHWTSLDGYTEVHVWFTDTEEFDRAASWSDAVIYRYLDPSSKIIEFINEHGECEIESTFSSLDGCLPSYVLSRIAQRGNQLIHVSLRGPMPTPLRTITKWRRLWIDAALGSQPRRRPKLRLPCGNHPRAGSCSR